MNLPSELERARMEHNQAKRHVRRIAHERAIRRANWLDVEYDKAQQRVRASLARLTALEQQQRGLAGSGPEGGDDARAIP